MAVTDQDIPTLVALTRRLRHDTRGCGEWQDAGIVKYLREMQTWNYALVVEQILRRATDPSAKTPATLVHKVAAPMPSEKDPEPFRPPKPHEACRVCGGYCPGVCVRDRIATTDEPPSPNLPPITDVNPRLAKRLRERLNPEEAGR